MRADYLNENSGISDHLLKVKKVVADTTLSSDDSGSIVLVNPAATTDITLPSSLESGWYCKIILTEDVAGSDAGMAQKVNIDFGSGNVVIGMISDEVDGAAGDYAVANDDFINCSASASPGDYVDVFTDGVNWYAYGVAKDATEMVFGTATA